MGQQEARPESITDLPNYVQTEQLAFIKLTQPMLLANVLPIIDALLHNAAHAYGEDMLDINSSGGQIELTRRLDTGELAKILAEKQEGWDHENDQRELAAKRAVLMVGDAFDVSVYFHTCKRQVCADEICVLNYRHYGECVAVRDGHVVGTRPGPRQ
jgi:hypothetical protein